jgi:protein-disulfide isomerase
MNKEKVIVGLVLCLLAGFAAGVLVQWPTAINAGKKASVALTHPVKGPEDAPIRIVEISDFQCPFCGKAALNILPQVVAAYPGKIAIEFWQNPLEFHKNALPAAKASLAAHMQGKFWEMHDLLFDNSSNLTPEVLLKLAGQIGLDIDRFKWDMADSRIEQFIANDLASTAAVGVSGTPMFFINGRSVRGAQPVEAFKAVIDEELKKAETALAGGTSKKELYKTLAQQNEAGDKFIRHFVEGQPAAGAAEKKKKKR